MNAKPRIKLDTTVLDSMYALSEGNPGAATVLADIIKEEGAQGALYLCHLDDAQIYGSDIWIGYKDVCDCDLKKFMAMAQDRTLKDAIVVLKESVHA